MPQSSPGGGLQDCLLCHCRKPGLGCPPQDSGVSGARLGPTLPGQLPSHWGTPAFLTCGYLLLLHLWNAARTLVSLPFPLCKECDYGTCLYSLGILGFVLVLTGLGTRVKQIHHVPLDKALLPRKAWCEALSTGSQLPTCLPQ